ncbi:MAG: M56 family metallopeptidase, partial [Chloroflexia bacterium]
VSRFSVARSWNARRVVQLAGIALPVVLLGLSALLTAHFLAWVCFWSAPPLDVLVTVGISLAGALVLIMAIAINILRAALLPWQLQRRTWDTPAWLQDTIATLAAETGLKRVPRSRVAVDERPWALVASPFRPRLVVSSGLIALLDKEELSAVLCHELIHLRRGDLWWSALAGMLRDLAPFLPSTRRMYQLLLAEQEIACDDQVIGESRRLALASSLARVWQAGISSVPPPRGALALLSAPEPNRFETRMRRLLERTGSTDIGIPNQALLLVGSMLGLFVVAQLWATAVAMDKMGCGLHQVLMMPH